MRKSLLFALEGKCFKIKNSYGGNSKDWWLYTKVVEVTPDDLYVTFADKMLSHYKGWSFQTSPDGNISIEKAKHSYLHGVGKEISQKEFDDAFLKIKQSLVDLP